MTLSVVFYPYYFVRTILSLPFCPIPFCPYHFVRTILSLPFCPIPFCPYTIFSIPFFPYHFVRYHFVLEPIVLYFNLLLAFAFVSTSLDAFFIHSFIHSFRPFLKRLFKSTSTQKR